MRSVDVEVADEYKTWFKFYIHLPNIVAIIAAVAAIAASIVVEVVEGDGLGVLVFFASCLIIPISYALTKIITSYYILHIYYLESIDDNTTKSTTKIGDDKSEESSVTTQIANEETVNVDKINTVIQQQANEISEVVTLDDKSIVVPYGKITDFMFSNRRDVSRVEISQGVTFIGQQAFYECSELQNVQISSGVRSIESWAFAQCPSLTSIRIPKSVVMMGKGVFVGCNNLTIYCEASEKPRGWHENWNIGKCKVVWGAK